MAGTGLARLPRSSGVLVLLVCRLVTGSTTRPSQRGRCFLAFSSVIVQSSSPCEIGTWVGFCLCSWNLNPPLNPLSSSSLSSSLPCPALVVSSLTYSFLPCSSVIRVSKTSPSSSSYLASVGTSFQIADVDSGVIRWVNADLVTHVIAAC